MHTGIVPPVEQLIVVGYENGSSKRKEKKTLAD